MADIRRPYGEYTADIRRINGELSADIRRTYDEHTTNIREHTADMRQKLPRTYGEYTPISYVSYHVTGR